MAIHNFQKIVFCFLFLFWFNSINAQVDHWETVVFANDQWKYQIGNNAFPNNWFLPSYNDDGWAANEGGFGYSDGDDGTTISATTSVAIRKEFEIIDLTKIEKFILSADYDDAFVAYLNGIEFARANIGEVGVPPDYNEGTFTDHEANLYQGQQPETYLIEDFQDLLQNGTNTLAIQVNNVTIFSSDLTANFFLSLGINDESSDYELPPNWFQPPFEFTSSDIPVLIINTNNQTIPNDPRIIAHLGIIDNGPNERNYLTDSFNGYDGQISLEIRGASSSWFDKKGYSFETQNADTSNNNVELLGMPEENDWVLHGPFSDKSLMRNMLTYHFARGMGQYAPRTQPCELMINEEYVGYYVLVESIKRDQNRVDIAKLTEEDIEGDELTGGYLMQIDRDRPDVVDGWYSNYAPYNYFTFDDPDYDEVQPAQWNYIQTFLNGFENAINASNYQETYDNLVDDDAFIDYVLASEIAKHIDAYRLSFFMYKKKDSNGGKLHLGPIWDINLGYGNYDYGCDNGAEGWSYDWGIPGEDCSPVSFWVEKIANIPDVQNKMKCRWDELREDVLATETLHHFIDSMTLVIDEAQGRNYQRWPVLGQYLWPNDFVGDTYQSEINYLKNWLEGRLNWMDDNINGDCSFVANNELEKREVELHVFPNPFQQEVNFLVKNADFKEGNIRIFDVLGKIVSQKEIFGNGTISLNTAEFENGVYFYELWIDDQLVKNSSMVKVQ